MREAAGVFLSASSLDLPSTTTFHASSLPTTAFRTFLSYLLQLTLLFSKLAMRVSDSYLPPSDSHLRIAVHTSPTKGGSGCIQIDHTVQPQPSSQSPMVFIQHLGCAAITRDVHMHSVAHGQPQDGYFTAVNASQDRGGYGHLTPGTVAQPVSYAFSQDAMSASPTGQPPLAPTSNMSGYAAPSEPHRNAPEPHGQGQMPIFVHEDPFDDSKPSLHQLDVIQGRALFWAPPLRYRQRTTQACECCRKRKSKASRS
ncbi:hypothetical protein C8Q80DRAFT_743153 [Daedaleopsis nitida]|nr:hypothetical protein C8Q80DRAFT_743153 [Daedaleopsis nitida]